MLRALASLVVPPVCPVCRGACEPAAALCAACSAQLDRAPAVRAHVAGLPVVSAVPYEGVGGRMVSAMKFARLLPLLDVAAVAMAEVAGDEPFDALVPVPASPARARARGFDLASELATRMARMSQAPRCEPVLVRADGPRQVGRTRRERLAAPPRVRMGGRTPAGRLCIVDDVFTTGATLSACAAALRRGGADELCAVTFARSAGLGTSPREA